MTASHKNQWEVYQKKRGKYREKIVTFYKGGLLALTPPVKKMVGSDYVNLLIDLEGNRFALKPSVKDDPNSFFLRPNKGSNRFMITIKSFLRIHSLEHLEGTTIEVEKQDDKIVINY